LKKGNKFLKKIAKEIIDQKILNYYKKIELFAEALKQNKEQEKIDILYEDSIKLYSKNKGFYLLIPLFIKIYGNQNLCPKLIEEFYKMNKDKKNDKNMDRKEDLNGYVSSFAKLINEADSIIRNKGYHPIQFYGIIFCYLNHYDYNNFTNLFKRLYKDNKEILFEILIIYKSNFLNPKSIEQNFTFFEAFIEYTIKNKEFNLFESSLEYILDIETFVNIINNKKELIIERYGQSNFKPIEINPTLKIYKKEEGKEIENIIQTTESIMNNKNILLIYFNSNFWINLLKNYNEPTAINIDICFKLRKLLNEYYKLIEELYKGTKKRR